MWYQNIRSALFSFLTIHASERQTDGQTDRPTELRQQYRALHYMQSHGKNGVLDQYGAKPLKQQQLGTAGTEGVKAERVFTTHFLRNKDVQVCSGIYTLHILWVRNGLLNFVMHLISHFRVSHL